MSKIKSVSFALTLFVASITISTAGGALTAAPAEAGVWTSVKGAAKTVARTAVSVEKGVVKGAKVVGNLAKKLPPVNGVIQAYKSAKYFATHKR